MGQILSKIQAERESGSYFLDRRSAKRGLSYPGGLERLRLALWKLVTGAEAEAAPHDWMLLMSLRGGGEN